MVDDRAEQVARWSIRVWAIGMLLLLAMIVGGWLTIRAVSAAVCANYNSFSNDFCDKYDTPPENAIPVPQGWKIVWQDLSCGSGGCPHRMYVLVPPTETDDSIARYATEAQDAGWREIDTHPELRKDDLLIRVESARSNVGTLLVPKRFGKPGNVYVSLGICGEATTCT